LHEQERAAILRGAVDPEVVFFQDRFVSPGEARIRVDDAGFLLGHGVFATLRGYHGTTFRPEAHLATLARGAEMLGIALPLPVERLIAVADEAAARTFAPDAYVRVTLSRGPPGGAPSLVVLARAMDVPSEEDYERGVDIVTVAARRLPPSVMDGTVKTTSYAPTLLARREAEARSAREGLQLAVSGHVACATMANVFAVVGDALLTPPLASGCRDGVTRRAVLELAAGAGLRPREEAFEPPRLVEADEIFLTSTRIECLPVAKLDGRAVGRGTFRSVTVLRGALHALALSETSARRERRST
jgi:branched-chain amino acid aminotransferase